MSEKINLNVDGDKLFGKHLPSVFINNISIDQDNIADGSERPYDYKFVIDLRINFTKEAEMQDPQQFMEDNFDQLYLYCWMSSFETLNTELQRKRLHLKDLFSAFDPQTPSTLTSDDAAFPHVLERIKHAFINKEHPEYFGDDTSFFSARWRYADATPIALEIGIDNPDSIWYHIFWGTTGEDGPWDAAADMLPWIQGWASGPDGDIETWLTEMEDIGEGKFSFMRKYVEENLYFLQASSVVAEHEANQLSHKIKLTDLLDPDAGWGGTLVWPQQFDSHGREIVQLCNITIPFSYEYDIGTLGDDGEMEGVYDLMKTNLSAIEKLFFITTIGLDDNSLGVSLSPRTLFNNYFGAISYEHVLNKNEVPNQLVEKFVEIEDGSPYNGVPFQGVDGKYYASEPVAHEGIVETFQKLADKYASMYAVRTANREEAGLEYDRNSAALDTNVKNLEYILSAHGDTVQLLREFLSYLQTYPDRSAASKSGELYSEVSAYLYAAQQTISNQRRVKKLLIRTGIITDYRRPVDQHLSYLPPHPLGSTDDTDLYEDGEFIPAFKMGTAEDPSNDYIPSAWSTMSRKAIARWVDPDMYGFGAEINSIMDQIDAEFTDDYGDYVSTAGTGTEYSRTTIYTDEMIEYYASLYWDARGEAGADLFPTTEAQNAASDFVVRNNGYFFFEWEKALRTQSALSHVVNLSRLQRYLRIAVPYQYFKTNSVHMLRKELHLADPGGTEIYAGARGDWGTGVLQSCWLNTDDNYPWSQYSTYWVENSAFGYGFPYVFTALGSPESTETREEYALQGDARKSYLKFVNFDTAYRGGVGGGLDFTSAKNTLIYYGFVHHSATDAASGVVGNDYATSNGFAVRDGYRLMCFEYADYMDDDVAYYNTIEEHGSGRSGELLAKSYIDEPCTDYRIEVNVTDRTPQFYVDFILPLFQNPLEVFNEYYNAAFEYCSYNNINNQFNQFFVDAMYARWPDPADQPWFRLALMYTLYEQIFFKTYGSIDSTDVEAMIMKYAAKLARTLSPKETNLRILKEFKCKYERTCLTQLYPANLWSGTAPSCEDYTGHSPQIWNRMLDVTGIVFDTGFDSDSTLGEITGHVSAWSNDLTFVNRIPIKDPIYGNFMLDTLVNPAGTELYVPHETVPPGHLYLTVGRASNDYVAPANPGHTDLAPEGVGTDGSFVAPGRAVLENGPYYSILTTIGDMDDGPQFWPIDSVAGTAHLIGDELAEEFGGYGSPTDWRLGGGGYALNYPPTLIDVEAESTTDDFGIRDHAIFAGSWVILKVRYGPSADYDTRIFAINVFDDGGDDKFESSYRWYNAVSVNSPDVDTGFGTVESPYQRIWRCPDADGSRTLALGVPAGGDTARVYGDSIRKFSSRPPGGGVSVLSVNAAAIVQFKALAGILPTGSTTWVDLFLHEIYGAST